MQIFHAAKEVVLSVPVEPLGTLINLDQTEIGLAERIVRGLLDMYDEDDRDEMYDKLLHIHKCISANMPTNLN